MAGFRDAKEFAAYQLADELRSRVRTILERPAFRKARSLQEQLERAVEGPCPNLDEGFSRYYPLDFARFARMAKSSLSETITHLGSALAKGIVTEAEHNELVTLARRARGATTGLVRYLEAAEAPDDPRHARGRRRVGGTPARGGARAGP